MRMRNGYSFELMKGEWRGNIIVIKWFIVIRIRFLVDIEIEMWGKNIISLYNIMLIGLLISYGFLVYNDVKYGVIRKIGKRILDMVILIMKKLMDFFKVFVL